MNFPPSAYGKVFLARKRCGADRGHLYAMKVLKKATIVQKRKTTEHTKTEREVLQTIRQSPFLVTMHYAFQTDSKLHLVLGEEENAKCYYYYFLTCDSIFLLKHLFNDETKKHTSFLPILLFRLREWR